MAPDARDVAAAIADVVDAGAFSEGERGGVWRDGARAIIQRLGLAVEPWGGLPAWARAHALDALFLHRPWRLPPGALDDGVAVLASHLPFDERLTTGWNPHLAERLGMRARAPLGDRDGRPIAMLGDWDACDAEQAIERVVDEFGGADAVVRGSPSGAVSRLCVAHAMTDALVRAAARAGATLYVTGQRRRPADAAVSDTRMTVVAVGHRRSEQWGIRTLAAELQRRHPAMIVHVAPAG